MAQAFILAAGFGTRLRPLTDDRPKPLAPVCGVPLLSYALAACHQAGFTKVIVNAHHLPEQLTRWQGAREGVAVAVSVETEILGTGGGLKRVAGALDPIVVVLNGDVLHNIDLRALIAATPTDGAAMALRPHEAERYGVVAADSTGTVTSLTTIAHAPAVGEVLRDTHFTGIHALSRSALELVPDGFACVVRSAYATLVPRRAVAGLRHAGEWLDIGDPAVYLAANLSVLAAHDWLPIDPFSRAAFAIDGAGRRYGDAALVAGSKVIGPVWIGHGVTVPTGSHIERAVIGDGAALAGPVTLREVVIWDGTAVAPGSYASAIRHDSGWLTP